MQLRYLAKQKGGRLAHVATFTNACKGTGDAQWVMNSTLQAHDEAAEEEFSHVGLTSLLDRKHVVKLMIKSHLSSQEVAVQRWFARHPHVNIVQGICNFECKDNPIRWKSRLTQPQPFCNGTASATPFVVIVQEYIVRGNLRAVTEWSTELWKSVILQLTYACMEWYEQGFLFGDWHFGNILLDIPQKKVHTYHAFGETFKVHTHNVSPVITDFARSTLRPAGSLELWMLTDQLALVWDLFANSSPFDQDLIRQIAIQMGIARSKTELLSIIKRFRR